MKKVVGHMISLLVVGLATAPAFAAELRVTGFFDNVFPRYERNVSSPQSDQDTTRNHDTIT